MKKPLPPLRFTASATMNWCRTTGAAIDELFDLEVISDDGKPTFPLTAADRAELEAIYQAELIGLEAQDTTTLALALAA